MTWVFGAIAVTLAIVFVWGLVAPRSQWRVLSGWSVSDTFANEPGRGGYGLRRLISALGLAGVAVVVIIGTTPLIEQRLRPPPPALTALQVMWGTPSPQLVARVIRPAAAPPEGLVGMPVLGYQVLDRTKDLPEYLIDLKPFSLLGDSSIPGYIGAAPEAGTSAYASADILVNVRGPVLCVPRQAVAIETETTIQIGIYYGLPDSTDGSAVDHVAGCPSDASVTGSVLIPLVLSAPIGSREVQTLDGTPIAGVRVVN